MRYCFLKLKNRRIINKSQVCDYSVTGKYRRPENEMNIEICLAIRGSKEQ